MCLTNCQILLVITAVSSVRRGQLPQYRVIKGEADVHNEFPYVVCLETIYIPGRPARIGTGTLLAPKWVLTAGHCITDDIALVSYGDMTIHEKSDKRRILGKIRHPNFIMGIYHIQNDVGMLLIEEVTMASFGKLGAVDYKTLLGCKVRYAGYGFTSSLKNMRDLKEELMKIQTQPLQLGEGVVSHCSHDRTALWYPAICVAAKCTTPDHDSALGDSGGPIFHRGKVVGVISGSKGKGQSINTPISPYLTWIAGVMTSPNTRQ